MHLILLTLPGAGRLLALGALLALLAAALLPLAPAAADQPPRDVPPGDMELVISLADDSDNIVPPGGEATVQASLRFPWDVPFAPPASLTSYTAYELRLLSTAQAAANQTDSRLRIGGPAVWDLTGSRRLDLTQGVQFFSRITWTPGAQRQIAKALDGRTLITRTNYAFLNIWDSYTLEHKGRINRPAGSNGSFHEGFGSTAGGGNEGGFVGSAIALWHETADRAWLFVGSWNETVEGRNQMGRLHIYRLDWDDDSVTVTSQGSLAPPLSEASNRPVGTFGVRYGAGVDISRDGGTLAVSAPRMNEMGAIYVYSRPDGPGEDWGDIAYADGVKVSAAEVPSFGVSTSTMPFDPTVDYDASTPRSCGDWCQAVWSNLAGNPDGVELGNVGVSLSADGRVLVAGAREKEFDSTERPTNANRRNNAGEVFVWVAPEGGWASAPRADRNADGDPRTLFAARTDATTFRRATHYSPGPLRRWTEPAAILIPQAWPGRAAHWFGQAVDVSPDGAVVAASDLRSGETIHVFQRDSADDWKTFNGGYLDTPSVSYSNAGRTRNSGIQFNYDGTQFVTGDTNRSNQEGQLQFFTQRPEDDGVWTSSAARRWVAEFNPVRNTYYGFAAHELTGRRVALSQGFGSRVYVSGLTASNGSGRVVCTLSMIDGVRTASCPLPLPNSTIVIPEGTPDGSSFTITGSVALRVSRAALVPPGPPDAGSTYNPLATLSDTLEVTVGTVDELTQIELDFDTDSSTGRPYPSTLNAGESTTLLLKLLNENGTASAKGAAATVLFTANQGKLNAKLGAAAGEACVTGGTVSCQIENAATALTAANADQIRLTVEHPGAGRSGPAGLRVTVHASDGESFEAGPINLIFSGPPSEIAVSRPSRGLLSYGTCDTPAADGPDDCKIAADQDDRDLLTLQVTALDESGNKATVPTRGYGPPKVTGPDGKRIASDKIAVTWPLRKDGDDSGTDIGDDDPLDTSADGAPQARINVNAAQTAQLPAGEYTVELSVGALRATQTFNISGPPASVTLSAPPGNLSLRDSFTVSATIVDAGGAPVPDGTPVSWSATPIAAASTLVETASERRTKDGQAQASYLVVAPGRTSLRVNAGEVTELALVEVVGPPAPPVRLLDLLANPYPQGSNIWFGEFAIRASSLLRELPDAEVVHIWQGNRWFRYSQVEGETGEESIDFTIHPNAILWFGDDD